MMQGKSFKMQINRSSVIMLENRGKIVRKPTSTLKRLWLWVYANDFMINTNKDSH